VSEPIGKINSLMANSLSALIRFTHAFAIISISSTQA